MKLTRNEFREPCKECDGTGYTNKPAPAGHADRVRKRYFLHCAHCIGKGEIVWVGPLKPAEITSTTP